MLIYVKCKENFWIWLHVWTLKTLKFTTILLHFKILKTEAVENVNQILSILTKYLPVVFLPLYIKDVLSEYHHTAQLSCMLSPGYGIIIMANSYVVTSLLIFLGSYGSSLTSLFPYKERHFCNWQYIGINAKSILFAQGIPGIKQRLYNWFPSHYLQKQL